MHPAMQPHVLTSQNERHFEGRVKEKKERKGEKQGRKEQIRPT